MANIELLVRKDLNEPKNKLYNCDYCKKNFTRIDNLNRHLKTCKEKKKDEEEKQTYTLEQEVETWIHSIEGE